MGSLKYLDTQKGLMFPSWGSDESLSRSNSEMSSGGAGRPWTGERRQREGTAASQVTASHLLLDTTAFHPRLLIAPKRQKKIKNTAPGNLTGLLFLVTDVWSEITPCSKKHSQKVLALMFYRCICMLENN